MGQAGGARRGLLRGCAGGGLQAAWLGHLRRTRKRAVIDVQRDAQWCSIHVHHNPAVFGMLIQYHVSQVSAPYLQV